MTRIELTPPAPFINANDRLHFRVEAKLTKAWRQAAFVAAKSAKLPPMERVRIVVHYRFPNNLRRETSNLQPTSKALVDGLVDAGICKDDRDEIVTGPDNRREWPNGPVRVVIELEEVS